MKRKNLYLGIMVLLVLVISYVGVQYVVKNREIADLSIQARNVLASSEVVSYDEKRDILTKIIFFSMNKPLLGINAKYSQLAAPGQSWCDFLQEKFTDYQLSYSESGDYIQHGYFADLAYSLAEMYSCEWEF